VEEVLPQTRLGEGDRWETGSSGADLPAEGMVDHQEEGMEFRSVASGDRRDLGMVALAYLDHRVEESSLEEDLLAEQMVVEGVLLENQRVAAGKAERLGSDQAWDSRQIGLQLHRRK